jgi:hypothetical protein
VNHRVQVHEWEDGQIEISHEGRSLPFLVFDKHPYVDQARVVDDKRLGAALAFAQKRQEARDRELLARNRTTLREKQWILDKRTARDRAKQPPPTVSR